MKKQRTDLKVRLVLDVIGATFTWLGIAGIAGATEGQGSFAIAVVVFLIGMAEVAWSYQR